MKFLGNGLDLMRGFWADHYEAQKGWRSYLNGKIIIQGVAPEQSNDECANWENPITKIGIFCDKNCPIKKLFILQFFFWLKNGASIRDEI